jgi:type I restriction enzyme M protein
LESYDVPPTSNTNYTWILKVSKLSETDYGRFYTANGALSGGGDEYKIRRKLIENDIDGNTILPRSMFYTTDIGITLWF